MIKWVVFDLSGVVFTEGMRAACKKIAAITGASDKDIFAYLKGDRSKAYRLGIQEPADFWAGFASQFKADDIDAVKRAFNDSYSLKQDAVDFVSSLRPLASVAFFSYSPKDRAQYLEEKLGFSKYFDRGLYTYDVGHPKSDPAAYGKLCELLGSTGPQTAFVDDSEENVKAAREAGLRAILFDQYDGFPKVASELRALGVDVPFKKIDRDDDPERMPM